MFNLSIGLSVWVARGQGITRTCREGPPTGELDRNQSEVDRKQAEKDRALIKSMLGQLVKDRIVSDEKEVGSLVLSADEFTVNGKRQSLEAHNSYKDKFLKKLGSAEYMKKEGTRVSYGTRSNGTFMSIDSIKKD